MLFYVWALHCPDFGFLLWRQNNAEICLFSSKQAQTNITVDHELFSVAYQKFRISMKRNEACLRLDKSEKKSLKAKNVKTTLKTKNKKKITKEKQWKILQMLIMEFYDTSKVLKFSLQHFIVPALDKTCKLASPRQKAEG